jgi:hypothetical protein
MRNCHSGSSVFLLPAAAMELQPWDGDSYNKRNFGQKRQQAFQAETSAANAVLLRGNINLMQKPEKQP